MDTKAGKWQGVRCGGGMNWDIGIDIYTLICIKWIANKSLMYKKISKIKFKNSKKISKKNLKKLHVYGGGTGGKIE